jgi:hypothetical protein
VTDELSPDDNFKSKRSPAAILVVDSGFDFIPETNNSSDDPHAKVAFPMWYFNAVKPDPENNNNPPPPTYKGRTESAGVNLSEPKTLDSATSSYDRDFRSHGLAVTTLVLGGVDVEQLRHLVNFGIKVTEASLVPLGTDPSYRFVIDRTELEDAVRLARIDDKFRVINLSLVSTAKLADFKNDVDVAGGTGLIIVSAAGNDEQDPKSLSFDQGPWPASWGGKPWQTDPNNSAYITVGAHDGANHWAKFSYYGESVDLLAPGCRVSYTLDLSKADKGHFELRQAYVTGTSFAAPVVSFAASLLSTFNRFNKKPGLVKERLILSSDYHYDLSMRRESLIYPKP